MKTKMTQDDFDKYLESEFAKLTHAAILSYGDVRTFFAETLNNEVIAAWERDNPLPTLEQQMEPMIPDWVKLIQSLVPQIGDEYRANEDDDVPGMCLTIGFTPETRDNDASWSYQTGDNSYSGGAYSHRYWGVVSIYRDSDAKQLADDAANQIVDQIV